MSTAVRSAGSVPAEPPHPTIHLRQPLLLLLLPLLLLGALFLPDPIWITLLAGFGGLVLVAYLWARALAGGLGATRRLRFGWVGVGDRLEEAFTLTNDSPVPALWVEIADASDVPGYSVSVVRSAAPRGRESWPASAICLRRGLFHLGPWQLRSGDPFGLFAVTIAYPARQEIIVHPPIHGDLPVPLPRGETSGRARARRRAQQATINAAAVRAYQPQDPTRHIHWPTSARRGQLFVREFDLDAAGDLWLLLDLQAAAQLQAGEAAGTEEHGVLLAASLAAQALAGMRGVGLAAYGRAPLIIPPATGQGQQWRLLRALAVARADGDLPLAAALRDLNRVARRGSAALIITPSAETAWLPELGALARGGVLPAAALLERRSFGGTGDSAALAQTIRSLGFAADVIIQGSLGRPLHEAARRGFWEFRVTPLGKVITVRRPEEGAAEGENGRG